MLAGNNTRNRTNRAYRIAFAALLLTVAAVFWRHLFTSDVLFYRDISLAHYPRAVELRAIVRQGLPPLWNPFEHFGEPVAANANYLLFYPTAWLAWVLPAAYGFKLHYALHFFVLAAGSFLLARRIGLGPGACYVAGALFVFGGPAMSLGNFYNLLPAAAWMPLVLLAADYQARRGGWRASALLAGALAMQLFAGEPFTSIVTAAMALAWSMALNADARARLWARANRRLLARFLAGAGLAAGLAAVQLLPALRHIGETQRAAGLTFGHGFYWSVHPARLLEVLVPRMWGSVFEHWRLPWLYLAGREPFLLSLFVGILPLALALLAAAVRSDRAARFWIVAAVLCLLLALGSYTPASYIFYYLIPVFRFVRFPVKFAVPASLAVAQLAAMGVEWLLTAQAHAGRARRSHWVAWGAAAFASLWLLLSLFTWLMPGPARRAAERVSAAHFDHAFALNFREVLEMGHAETVARAASWLLSVFPTRLPYVLAMTVLLAIVLYTRRGTAGGPAPWILSGRWRAPAVYGAVAVAIATLIVNHYTLNPLADGRCFADRPPVLDRLAVAHPPLRVFAEPVLYVGNLPSPYLFREPEKLAFLPPAARLPYTLRMSLQLGAGTLGLENTFTADPEVILPAPQRLLNNIVFLKQASGDPLGRFLALGSVEYMLLRARMPGAPGPAFQMAGSFSNGTTVPVGVFRVVGSLPRAYLVPAAGAVALPPGIPTLEHLVSPQFDPRRNVVLVAGHAPAPPAPASHEPAGEAQIVRRDALAVDIEATASAPAYLVLTDSYNPDWKVTVDGKPAELLRANQIFRAAALTPGTHRVSFRYRPLALFLGAAISLATALGLLAMSIKSSGERPPM